MNRPSGQGVLGRRSFLGAAAALGTTAGLLARAWPAGAAAIDLPPGAGTLGQGTFELFAQADLNFQTLIALGGAGINSAVGEVVGAVAQAGATPGGASYQSVYDAMIATGNRLLTAADDAAKAKRKVTARDRYLRAAQYYNQALFWVLGTSTPDAEESVYRAMDAAWTEAAKRQEPEWEPLEIPYRRGRLPAWFLRAPGATGRRPTLIMNNGSDGQNVDMLPQGGTPALARGWNVLIFEGPGQGRSLFVEKVPFTPDWHGVVSPIVDELQGRRDVDPKRIALLGVSLGGLLVARAAASERRLAALVTDPGCVSDWAAFPEDLRTIADSGDRETVNRTWNEVIVPGADPMQRFTLQKRLEIFSADALAEARAGKIPTDWYGLSRRIQEFTLGDLATRITMPTLAIQYELDAFVAGQGRELYDRLPGPTKDLVDFTVIEGAQYHDAPIGSQWHGEVVMDWLNEQVS